jgi:catechol 2,3-dioxygenase-like lactoylglutathione lyase family enzyme
MKLVRTCIMVSDVATVRDFYERVLEIVPSPSFPEYVEFDIGGTGLALFDVKSHEQLAPGSVQAGQNRCSMIEIEVEDVDREFERLGKFVKEWVKPPTTQPWGTRSIYFRDPEGNLINCFTRPKPHSQGPDSPA